MPISIMSKKYSHRPFKKRPVEIIEEEPENLSTKPEDLLPHSTASSPMHSPSRYSPSPETFNSKKRTPSPEYSPQTWYDRGSPPLYYPAYPGMMYPYLFNHNHQQIQDSSVRSTTTSPQDLKNSKQECSTCGKTYSTSSGLAKNRQFHCAVRKSFSCQSCDKVYTSLGALKMHIRTHTLPCKCDICGKAFSRPWLLQGHVRTHTGEKPFTCQHCSRAFADRSNLRAHLQTHTDVKRYSCGKCEKSFSRVNLLTKHMERDCNLLYLTK